MGAESDDEFRDFMQGRWSAMVRLAYTLTGDQGHAEDIAQAAFSSAYAAWGRVRRAGDPDAYVRAIVIHENSKRFRKQRVREDLRAVVPERGTGADDSLADRAALHDALSRLGPRQRAVIVLRFWLDMSEAATAQALNCSVGTVKSQTSRALATLRKHADITEGELR
jgi:RNA polymerase sigma-70 factor (sigma-E family)